MNLNGIFKYGTTCYLALPQENWCSEHFKAYLQPIRYKTKVYLEGDFTEIGRNTNDVFLYLGPAAHDITRLSENARISDGSAFYKIDKCERVMFNGECAYIWAVVRRTTEAEI